MTIAWAVAREKQLGVLRDLLAECDRDGAGAAVVTGVTGVGKSALIARFAEYATDAGALVLTSIGTRDMRDRTLGVLGQLLAEHVDLGRATDPQPSATEPPLSMELAFSTLIELASERTVLLVIDDAHLCDAVSLFCVAYFLNTMSLLPIMIVLAGSTELATSGGAIPLNERCIHVALEPFTELEVQELADRVAGRRTGAAFARMCHAATGGNPRLVHALLVDSRHRRIPGGIELGTEFAAAMHGYLARSPRALREVATAAAVMGDESTPLLISDVTRLGVPRVMRAFRALNESGILVDTRFRHAGARELILSWTHNWDQIRLRRRAVDHIWKNGGGEKAVEQHLVAISRLSEESLRPVLERCDIDGVDAEDVELAMRCLDCATCADASEHLEPAALEPPPGVRERPGAVARRPRPTPAEAPALELSGGVERNSATRPDRDTHARPDSVTAKLSSAECRVAELAARGHTNKAISHRLSITVSTVEQHLTRVYRKLNIQERQDLRLVMDSDSAWIAMRPHTPESLRKNRGQ